MKFPGLRKQKHYFPVEQKDPLTKKFMPDVQLLHPFVCGIDQIVVDIEAHVDDAFMAEFKLQKGMSQVVPSEVAEALYQRLEQQQLIKDQFAGGTIGNTLHNYSVLADDRSVLFGVMSETIRVGSYAYRYLCNTSSRVDLNYLQPVAGPIGRAYTLITPCGERTFAIDAGMMNKLSPAAIPTNLVEQSAALVISAYLMRGNDDDTMKAATMLAVETAVKANVPVVLTLGTKFLIEQNPQFWRDFIRQYVDVVAMNEEEAAALTGQRDPLLAAQLALEWTDMVLLTAGPSGLYMAGYCDKSELRETDKPLLPGAIPEFNRFEYSRPMRKSDCQEPVAVFSHVAPYMGGPDSIKNTNGAGDGALAALLHDMVANAFHRINVPQSAKHMQSALTYSSVAQICKYANRVSYQVLIQHSPRLSRGLPEREDSLEEAYWE